MSLSTTLKPKNCPVCERRFMPARPMQKLCGQRCATKVALAQIKERKAKEKAARAQDREKREAMKTIADLIGEAQRHFNAYIRARDEHKGCFTCGKPFPPNKPGGSIDAGHWITRGHATHLRFNEDNCFGQCKGCNRPGGASRAQLRDGAVRRIGVERADAVENNYEVHKWQRDELKQIATTYKAKLKELKQKENA